MKNQEKYENVFIESFGVTKAKLKKDLKYNSIPKWGLCWTHGHDCLLN